MVLRLQTLSRSFRRMKYLTQTEAQNVSDFHPFVHNTQITQLDKDLMGEEGGFTLQQLMELAGLACAQTVQNLYPAHTHNKVLVAAGSGNQGGDGLVAARHLALFGYKPTLFYPKVCNRDEVSMTSSDELSQPSKNEFNQQLETQLKHFNVPRITPEEFDKGVASNDVILDAIFGFSFKGEPRAPFDAPIETLKQTNKPIVSVDIPSAWDVEKGNIDNKSFTPAALISLTAPKLGVKQFTGVHYLGGRFVPPYIAEKYALHLPVYPGGDQVVEIPPTSL
ncbi:YjeF N-terminal domain-like protein [Wallemia mellicola]|nr:YjeF N-terminal domain-like protein [Wallemia mellicola]TIC00620.1 YjeF N-terminal domain-like protein [Wallemia mellicola]TIC06723.1 YjeF N-terminal domain-like protein [Wallemia mellicola]TIC12346.1 YjeF N-terminal domain-like protein [Wallemia mellicola]